VSVTGILSEIGRRKRWERQVLRDALSGDLRVPPDSDWLPSASVLEEAKSFLRQGGRAAGDRRGFAAALTDENELRVIAEIKRRSPSAGAFASWTDPAELAASYASGGAAAVSVLTDAHYFGGRPGFLTAARQVFGGPALRKDFLHDELDLAISAALGADAVLLIVAMLGPETARLVRLARAYELDVLVEVHDQRELELAMASGAPVLGINNRDLRTFKVDLGTTERLACQVPGPVVVVGESGVKGPADAARLRKAGCDAILVGESLARSGGAGLEELKTVAARGLRA
jgi:indole-3-glycerol phosphate synthase